MISRSVGPDFLERYYVVSCPPHKWWRAGQRFLLYTVKMFLRLAHWPLGMIFESESGVQVKICGEKEPGKERLEVIERKENSNA